MHGVKNICIMVLSLIALHSNAQTTWSYDEVNTKSYALYEKNAWKELLHYGREAIAAKQDFKLLRLRLGYAAFMLENYSEALNQYEQVLINDSYNATAHYYIWLCRKYLNQHDLADHELAFFSKEDLAKEKLTKLAFTQVGIEASLKTTDNTLRGNTNYEKLEISNRFGWNIHMTQAVALFNQNIYFVNIPRPGFPPPPITYRTSSINQTEYYNRLTINLGRNWQVKGAYHYTYTPVDNNTFQNKTVFGALKYYNTYFDFQASANFSTVSDTSISQYDAQLGIYPFGNLSLYSFSTAIIRNRPSGSAFNFRQILGVQVAKKIWVEANVTLGKFSDLFENDAMYIYNQIDPNQFKGGLTAYASLSPKCVLAIGYTLEQRIISNTTNTFNQHSITGGLSWKF